MTPRTCVSPQGRFIVGIHDPGFKVSNLRQNTFVQGLGQLPDGHCVDNQINFPKGGVEAEKTDRIYEIANPFPFRGATFINSAWADLRAGRPEAVSLPPKPGCSLLKNLEASTGKKKSFPKILDILPRPLLLALAQASTDPEELAVMARKSCALILETGKGPTGLEFNKTSKGYRPLIHDHDLYEILGNNPFLPDAYKEVMVLRPGIQGSSEIIGEAGSDTHVFEYLRRNSYIPWGHFASNMANDKIRYRAKDLTLADMRGLRHLYYQRIYVRTAQQLGIDLPLDQKEFTLDGLEALRLEICRAIAAGNTKSLNLNTSLWGWNFGFGFAQSGHRLHASHQMIHQQNAMVPEHIQDKDGNPYGCFSCGDLVTDFICQFKAAHNQDFFPAYIKAVQTNQRTDGKKGGPSSLIVFEDDQVLLFAPKAQVSEWELQLMTKKTCPHILAADPATRNSLDLAMLTAIQVLEKLGAQMVTGLEFSARFNKADVGQHLVYSFIPRLPYAPATFSEAQLRWISGCYPEDFARACCLAKERP